MISIDQEARQNVERFLRHLQLCLDYAENNNTIDKVPLLDRPLLIRLFIEDRIYALDMKSPEESVSCTVEQLLTSRSFIRKKVALLISNATFQTYESNDYKFLKVTVKEIDPQLLDETTLNLDLEFRLAFNISEIKKDINTFMDDIFGITCITDISSYKAFRRCIEDFLNGSVPKCQGCVKGLNAIIDRAANSFGSLWEIVKFKPRPTEPQTPIIAYDEERIWYIVYKNGYWKLKCQSIHTFIKQLLS